MNSLRIARAAFRARPVAVRAAFQRRGYAEAVSDKVRHVASPARGDSATTANNLPLQLKLSLSLPHQVR